MARPNNGGVRIRRVIGPNTVLELEPRCPVCGIPHVSNAVFQEYARRVGRGTLDMISRNTRPKLTPEFLVQHRDAGMSVREIGAYHGYSGSSITRAAQAQFIEWPPKRYKSLLQSKK